MWDDSWKNGFPDLVGKRVKDIQILMVNKLRVYFESEKNR